MPLVCSWCKFGVVLARSRKPHGREPARAAVPCTLHGGKWRAAPCNPAFPRSQPTARRSERRAARGWTACARAYHRATSRYGLLSTLRIEARGGKRCCRHRADTCKTHLIATPMHPRQLSASRSARNFQETFRYAKTCPASSVLFPLTRAAEGVRAWQAVRRRAGHGARAAPMPERHSHGIRTTRKVPK